MSPPGLDAYGRVKEPGAFRSGERVYVARQAALDPSHPIRVNQTARRCTVEDRNGLRQTGGGVLGTLGSADTLDGRTDT